jgi:hypothetical protein
VKLKSNELPLNFAFNFNLRRYTMEKYPDATYRPDIIEANIDNTMDIRKIVLAVGRCRVKL